MRWYKPVCVQVVDVPVPMADDGVETQRSLSRILTLRVRLIFIHAEETLGRLMMNVAKRNGMLNGDYLFIGSSLWTYVWLCFGRRVCESFPCLMDGSACVMCCAVLTGMEVMRIIWWRSTKKSAATCREWWALPCSHPPPTCTQRFRRVWPNSHLKSIRYVSGCVLVCALALRSLSSLLLPLPSAVQN